MATQLSHEETIFTANVPNIILVCDNVNSPANIGSLFRACDALGINQIYFCGTTVDLGSSRLKRTARSTENNISFKDGLSIINLLETFNKKEHSIIALELTTQSIPLETFKIDKTKTTILIIGNEKNGISIDALRFAKTSLHIEMQGKNSSMNVIQATSIALFALTKF
ncbi:RNA methyltransferase [Patiriisocius marinistellae]|uniref:RNA methyltransferase n=1 Tax=Patiriisocius marinistellae TaxID=2494560 RepID=A0A5J4FY71_9FLAO|nr:TrmH family RNA methyltransferase [Patiriisocius marinistellae]GEQ86308.1 RNA methyltransferase [Patiriisocius marinistellae]